MKTRLEHLLQVMEINLKQGHVWGFFLALGILILYGNLTSPRLFQYDPGYYWDLRTMFLDSRRDFHLLNYHDWIYQLRGYLFPLFLLIAEWVIDVFTPDWVVDDFLTVVIFNAFQIALAGWFFIPKILSFLTGKDINISLRVFILGILVFFWRGFLYLPYSDLPAFFCFLVAVLFFGGAIQSTGWRSIGLALLAGGAATSAYLIRPVYLPAWIVLITGLILLSSKSHAWFHKLLNSGAFLLATILLIIPQSMINKIHYGINTPFTSPGLYGYQVTVGFLLQRFDVNMDTGIYPYSSIRFIDPQGVRILEREERPLAAMVITGAGIDGENVMDYLFSPRELVDLWLNYPLDIVTIYFRHFFNGLNLMFPSVYVWDVYHVDIVSMWLNYTILFGLLFLFDIRTLFARDMPFSSFVLLAWLLPVLTSIPGAVEARYFLPLHALLEACFVGMVADFTTLKAKIEQLGILRLLFLYVIFVLMAFSLSGLILTSVPDANLLLTPR